MKKFYWISKDYYNNGLNELAKRLTEYRTAELLGAGYTVMYSYTLVDPQYEQSVIGKIMDDYTVADSYLINDILNFNLYFTDTTENQIECGSHFGSFDCLVSLASGETVKKNPTAIGLTAGHHYVIDISPTAIHKSLGLYKELSVDYTQLDIFNIAAVKEFLSTCKGTKGFFVVSNCFCYIVSSLVHDVHLRLEMQNKFIDTLANDKIDWYVKMLSADGTFYECVRAKEIVNKKLDEKFKVLPWIQ